MSMNKNYLEPALANKDSESFPFSTRPCTLSFSSWYVYQMSATSDRDLSPTRAFFITSSKVLGPAKLKLKHLDTLVAVDGLCDLAARRRNLLAIMITGIVKWRLSTGEVAEMWFCDVERRSTVHYVSSVFSIGSKIVLHYCVNSTGALIFLGRRSQLKKEKRWMALTEKCGFNQVLEMFYSVWQKLNYAVAF